MTAAIEQFDLPDAPIDAGVSLIEASAGTGKTYNIAGLFVRLLLEGELEASQILTVTFTDAATKELRDRIGRRLAEAFTTFESGKSNDEFMASLLAKAKSGELDATASKMRLRLALAEFDTAPIYTIHSFCQRMLADRAFECGRPFHTELAQFRFVRRQLGVEGAAAFEGAISQHALAKTVDGVNGRGIEFRQGQPQAHLGLSLIHISEPTRRS